MITRSCWIGDWRLEIGDWRLEEDVIRVGVS